jgi:eukaryotic-like serine/threonine-protein kinase
MMTMNLFAACVVCVVFGACREPTAPPTPTPDRWFVQQPGYAYARPAVGPGVVYFGTGDGQVIARDPATGAARWKANIGVELIGGWNLIVRGGVVVAPVTGYTSAVDTATGHERWRYLSPLDTVGAGSNPPNLGFLVNTHIDADDSTVYIPAWGASISAVDLASGVARWVWRPARSAGDTATNIFRSGSDGVRVSGDTIFATVWHFLDRVGIHSEAWLVALDKGSGRELWRAVMPQYSGGVVIQGAPALYANLVIFTSAGGYCYAVDRTTHAVVWQHTPVPQHTTSAQAEVADGVVYIDGGDGSIYALNAADGTVRWQSPVGAEVMRDFLITSRRVIFPSGRYLFILDRQSGQEIARVTEPHTPDDASLFASSAAAIGSQIFISVTNAAWSFDEP